MTRGRTFRYQLQPTNRPRVGLESLLRLQCELSNAALEERRGAWTWERRSISYVDQTRTLTTLVKVRCHRPWRGTPKAITVRREDGRWWVSVRGVDVPAALLPAMAATRRTRAGKVTLARARLTRTSHSSRGWRNASSTEARRRRPAATRPTPTSRGPRSTVGPR